MSASAGGGGRTLRVATFNTHFGCTRRGRRFDIVATIAGLDADVIALQEVWEPRGRASFAAEAAADLGFHLHEAPVAPGVVSRGPDVVRDHRRSEGWWGLALLSRFALTPREPIPLGRILTDPAPRVAVPAEVHVPGGPPLLVAVTHVSHRLSGSPRQIRRLWAHLPRDGQPTVALGDFNLWGPPVSLLFPGWRRAVRGRTWPAHRPHSQIDHILVNEPIDVLGGEVLPATGSDHRPVRATLLV